MTDQPIIVRCMCCDRADQIHIEPEDFDALADYLDSQED